MVAAVLSKAAKLAARKKELLAKAKNKNLSKSAQRKINAEIKSINEQIGKTKSTQKKISETAKASAAQRQATSTARSERRRRQNYKAKHPIASKAGEIAGKGRKAARSARSLAARNKGKIAAGAAAVAGGTYLATGGRNNRNKPKSETSTFKKSDYKSSGYSKLRAKVASAASKSSSSAPKKGAFGEGLSIEKMKEAGKRGMARKERESTASKRPKSSSTPAKKPTTTKNKALKNTKSPAAMRKRKTGSYRRG